MAASIKCDDRPFKGGGLGFAPPAKNRGVWGAAAPQPKFFEKTKKDFKIFNFFSRYLPHGTLLFSLKEGLQEAQEVAAPALKDLQEKLASSSLNPDVAHE